MFISILQFPVILLSTLCLLSVRTTCPNLNYESNSFSINSEVIYDHFLTNSTFLATTTVNEVECFKECLQNCSCLSMNYLKGGQEKNCLLNNLTEKIKPKFLHFKASWRYYHFVRENEGNCSVGCRNTCCATNNCLHGGTCSELCPNQKRRFRCTCKKPYSGHRCETYNKPRSCTDLKEEESKNGWYEIYTTPSSAGNLIYCDFKSRDDITWTLVQSYSYSQSINAGVLACEGKREGQRSFNSWNLDLSDKKALRSRSSHWRITCEYDKQHKVLENYIVGKFDQIDLTAEWSGLLCRRLEEINIMKTKCKNCSATMIRDCINLPKIYFVISGKNSSIPSCTNKLCSEECYFGSWLQRPNKFFSCNLYTRSTTQFWFGSV